MFGLTNSKYSVYYRYMAKAKKKALRSNSGQAAGRRNHHVGHPKSMLITWIILGALVVGLAGGYLVAKAKYTHYIGLISVMFSEKDSELNRIKGKLSDMNGVMNVGGKMVVMEDGTISVMEESMTMSDGTTVEPNGYYQRVGEERTMMQDGQAMDMDGRMIENDPNRVEF